jgi:uncharacterized RDD family membrane protein YckC
MFTSLRSRLAGIWVFSVAVLAACSVVLGLSVSASTAVLWLVACVVPPGVMLMVWPSAPPLTIAELLHSVDAPSRAGRQ